MNITQIYLQLGEDIRPDDGRINVGYQNLSTYMVLPVSAWLRAKKSDIGSFNRIGFEESTTNKDDFHVPQGCNVLIINLKQEFQSLTQFSSAEVTHQYFKRKYIEGFKRFDAHFGLSLTPDLEAFLEDYFKHGYVYEKEMKAKRINGLKHQVLKQYKYDVFNLVLREFDKSGAMLKETILQSGKPDPFLVHYNVNKVNILENKIEVLGSTGKVETEHSLVMH